MQTKPSRSTMTLLVPCLAVALLMQAAGACLGEPRTRLVELEEMDRLDREVRAHTRVASRADHLADLDRVRIVWLSARKVPSPDRSPLDSVAAFAARRQDPMYRVLTTERIEDLMRWVARGNALWVDVRLGEKLGLTACVGGGVDEAMVAPSAELHPLTAGVTQVQCMDAFAYLTDLPRDATPIMVAWNREEHVVLASWLLGRGLILFRPEARREVVDWRSSGERAWIEPDLADGRRLLHNMNAYTVSVLSRSRRWPVPEAPPPPHRSLLDAFGVTGPHRCTTR